MNFKNEFKCIKRSINLIALNGTSVSLTIERKSSLYIYSNLTQPTTVILLSI